MEQTIRVTVARDAAAAGQAAAELGAEVIRTCLASNGAARIVLATGASQFAMLEHLVAQPGIDWAQVTAFHLDEYIGLDARHPASFHRYLRERFVDRVQGVRFVPIDGLADPVTEAARLAVLIAAGPIDLCFAGVGENCHLAFNDPPADFEAEAPYLAVTLDEACRRQQLGEGWFADLNAVPRRALSMSIRQIMRCERIVLTVPDTRKSRAVRDMLHQPISPLYPASILRTHPDTALFLDPASAALLP